MGFLPGISLLRLRTSNRHRRLLPRRVRLGRYRSAIHFSVGLAKLRDHGEPAIEGRQSARNRHHRERKCGLDGVAIRLPAGVVQTGDPSFGVSVFGVCELSDIGPGQRELRAARRREQYRSGKINIPVGKTAFRTTITSDQIVSVTDISPHMRVDTLHPTRICIVNIANPIFFNPARVPPVQLCVYLRVLLPRISDEYELTHRVCFQERFDLTQFVIHRISE